MSNWKSCKLGTNRKSKTDLFHIIVPIYILFPVSDHFFQIFDRFAKATSSLNIYRCLSYLHEFALFDYAPRTICMRWEIMYIIAELPSWLVCQIVLRNILLAYLADLFRFWICAISLIAFIDGLFVLAFCELTLITLFRNFNDQWCIEIFNLINQNWRLL